MKIIQQPSEKIAKLTKEIQERKDVLKMKEKDLNALICASTFVECEKCTEAVSIDQLVVTTFEDENYTFKGRHYETECPACGHVNICEDHSSFAFSLITNMRHLFKADITKAKRYTSAV